MFYKINKIILLLLVIFNGTGCANEHVTLSGKSLNTKNTIKFRTIDKGEMLFDKDYNFPITIKTEPGKHELSVMCEFFYTDGSKLVPGHFDINVEGGKSYNLEGVLSENGKYCILDNKSVNSD